MSGRDRVSRRGVRRAALVLLGLGLVLCGLCARARADTGIAYDSTASPSGLWTMTATGTNPQPFIAGASGVNFSADQSKMVYQVGGEVACNVDGGTGQIIAANADGSDPVTIGTGGCSPRISPDGTQVLYLGTPVNGSATPLFVAKISDPTNPLQLLPFPGPGGQAACIAFVNASFPKYPNNQSVCNFSQLAAWVNNSTIVVSGFQNGLWDIPVTGGDPHPILSGADQDSDWYSGLSVSPDGSTIAGYPLSQTAGSNVLATVPSGGGPLNILYDQGNTGVSYQYPQWLDDQTLVMQHVFGPAASPTSTIAVSSASAFNPTDLNASDTTASFPAPAPVCPASADGQASAFDRQLSPTANALGLCELDLAAQASTTEPTSGYADQNGNVEFVTKLTDAQPQPVMVGSSTTSFLQSCLSGCVSVAVRATAPGGAPVPDASVTATLNPLVFQAAGVSIPSPFSVLPPSTGVGVLCAVGATSCGQSATATTDDNGFAQFRYWLPGLVEAAINVAYPGPAETIKFDGTSAHGVCLCGAEGKTSLSLELKPRLWVNRDAQINPDEIDGLKAILSQNATNAKNAKTRATNIIKLLQAARYLNGVVIKSLKGLTDIGQSDAMVRLMHQDASSVMLAWFMGKFQIAGDGLLDGNLDPRAWGQELKPVMVNFLANKIEGAGKLGKAIGKFDKQLRDRLDALLEKGIGKAFEQQATTITKEIIERHGRGTATIKLFDVSACASGLCLLPPSPIGASQQLFLMFSEVNAGQENYFWPHGDLSSEPPLNIDVQRWINAQCKLSCDGDNK